MRVILGLAALAAVAQGQTTGTPLVTPSSLAGGSLVSTSALPVHGSTPTASIYLFIGAAGSSTQTVGQSGTSTGISDSSGNTGSNTGVNTGNQIVSSSQFGVTIPSTISTLTWLIGTNAYVGQMAYKYPTNSATLICDPCTNAGSLTVSTTVCNTASGPTVSGAFPCNNLQRYYTYSNINQGVTSFFFEVWDVPVAGGASIPTSYSFSIIKAAPAVIGDPQISGMQGQDFQVHGMPDEIFNMITYPNLQVNARFVYLSSGACHDNFTACFAHPGTYISEEGIRLGSDKIHVAAGSFKKGLTVSVNGKKIVEKKTSVKLGSVELVNHRRVVIKTPIMAITISNSDKFLNQETLLFDSKLLALGAERTLLGDGEAMHPEVPLHGLQGQTWRNVEYPSGLDYEGSISDYHVTSGNLYGTEFVFNQFKQ